MKAPRGDTPASAAPDPAPARRLQRTPAAAALQLQRAAGNRAAGRVLARYVKHPDEEKKGIMVPDVSASEYLYFNPPKNE